MMKKTVSVELLMFALSLLSIGEAPNPGARSNRRAESCGFALSRLEIFFKNP